MIKEESDRKLKFYSYKKLCSLARKGVHSLYDNFYLEMLGAAYLQRRINIVDIVINLINENVPLRLSLNLEEYSFVRGGVI